MILRKMRGSNLGFLMIFFLGFELGFSVGEEDGARLMEFKKSSVDFDPDGFFTDWDINISSDPCSWRGVVCSGGHGGGVTSLNLTGGGITGRLDLTALMAIPTLTALHFSRNFFSGNLSFDSHASSNCPFQTVDLSFNHFSDSPAANSLLLACRRLVSLDLSGNQLSDSSLLSEVSLTGCGSLVALNFSGNKLTGNFPASSFSSSCRNLSSLDISGNHLSGDIPTSFPLPPALTFLDLSRNNFTGIFQTLEFQSCQNLLQLRLAHNDISGTGFPVSLSACRNLETLDVSYNALSMEIPGAFLGRFKKLKKLSLSHNQFTGQIPAELGNTCASLEELDLSGNRLTGELPRSFISCSLLSGLNLGHNNLSGEFLTTVVSSLPSLKYLYVPFNNISGILPLSLANSSQLQVLDLSSNEFTGAIPPEICNSKSALEKILLPNNFLSGSIPSGLGSCKNLRTIDLSFNNLSGSIPLEIWGLPSILDVVMWANNLSGEIPEGICTNGGGNLQTLILNNNVIAGTIPRSIINCTDLIWVSLSSNRLTGDIPDGIGNLSNLAILQLGNNSLSGEIPSGLGDCKNLIWLDLNSNNLSGTIPTQLANSAGLVLPGPVSGKQFAFVRNEGGTSCRGAGGLIEFEGIRVDRFESFPMVHSCPSTRIYTGTTVYTFERNGSMIYLDLSYNSFSGTIPETLGSLSFLQVLNLGHNYLTGNIPISLGDLKAAGVLDLSHNNLQGFIPGSLGGLSFLSDLDVSNNNLTGPIPSGGQLTTFPASRYENNTGLCGLPLPPCGSSGGTAGFRNQGTKKNKNTPTTGVIVGITMSLLIIIMLMLALFRLKTRKRREEEREKYIESLPTSGSSSWKLSSVPEPLSINIATFEKPLRKLTFGHLLEATNGFSADSLIGSGGFGDVYKARLKDGCIVAIKKLIHVTSQGDREFVAEMETIGKIKHRNLVPLLGYCKIGEERLLVYEYMKWGSLESVLHERVKSGAPKLDWASRKKIAIGSARGLAFLHHSCLPHIIHRDMKSSNVLLDEDFEARVSDFGMARLVNALDTHLSVSTLAGTPGYVPPEYYQSFRCTTKGDVYSYGVVLLELVSGKKPIDPVQFGDDNNLVGWAKQLQREKRVHDILDPELLSDKSSCEAELLHYLKICFQCLDDKSWRRPTMIQVMTMFKELQEDSGSDILDGLSMKSSVIDESQEKEQSGDTN